MGKSKKSRQSGGKQHRLQPTGLLSVEETVKVTEEEGIASPLPLGSGIPASVHACVEQLQSHESLEKECGLLTLAELCGQPEAAPIFKETRLTRYVAPLALDPEEGVRVAAVATLLSMATTSSEVEETIDRMVQDDVMTPITALLKKHFPFGWTPGAGAGHPVVTKESDVFVNAVSLLRCLCGSSPAALHAFNRDDAIASLLSATDVKTFSQVVVIAVCECLLTVTENNLPAIQSLKLNGNALQSLQQLVELHHEDNSLDKTDAKVLLTSVLAAGILLNLSGEDLSSASPDLLSSVMTLIPAVLKIDVEILVNDLKRNRGKDATTRGTERDEDEGMMEEGDKENTNDGRFEEEKDAGQVEKEEADLPPNAPPPKGYRQKALERICDFLTAQQICLEILTNVCSAADDEWEKQEGDDDSSTSSEGQLEAATSSGNITDQNDDDEASSPTLPPEIRDVLMSSDTLQTITRFCGSTHSSSRVGLEESLDLAQALHLTQKLNLVQTRGLIALHNVVASEASALGGFEGLLAIFAELTASLAILLSSESKNDELLEAMTSAIRAVVMKISEDKSPASALRLFTPTTSDVHSLVEIFKARRDGSDDRSVKVNVIKIVSIMASSSNAKDKDPEILKMVGSFLLSAAVDADLGVAAEALDSIIDVFGGDDLGDDAKQVESDIRLVIRLKDLIPGFQDKVRQQRKRLGPEQKAVVQTVKANLLRFIKYKMNGSS